MKPVGIASREDIGKLVKENIDNFREEGVHNDVEFTQRFVAIQNQKRNIYR